MEIKPQNGSVNQHDIAVLIPKKVDFKSQWIRRDKVGSYILIKGTIYEKSVMIINIMHQMFGNPNF